MIIIKIMGGFASQLNKYIFGYNIAEFLGAELGLDISDYYRGYFRPLSLCYLALPDCKVFTSGIKKKDFKRLKYVRNNNDFADMLINYSNKNDYYIDREETDFADALKEHQNLLVNVQSSLIRNLNFRVKTVFLDYFRKEIKGKISVAVHVRRGDFVTLGWQDDVNFYYAAIEFIKDSHPDAEFYFFSNDLSWTKQAFGYDLRYHYINSYDGNLGDVEELFCISECNFRILSQYSSYGLLANIIAGSHRQNGFAVISGNISGAGRPETLNDIHKSNINLCVKLQSRLTAVSRGGLIYLTENEIEDYSSRFKFIDYRNYSNQIIGMQCSDSSKIHAYVNKLGMNVNNVSLNSNEDIYKLRYKAYAKEKESNRLFDILNTLSNISNNEWIRQEWRNYYHVDNKVRKKIIIFSNECPNKWYVKRMLYWAILNKRIDNDVVYVNIYNIGRNDRDVIEVPVKNMDGVPYNIIIKCIKKCSELFELFDHINVDSFIFSDIAIPLFINYKKVTGYYFFDKKDSLFTLVKKFGLSKLHLCNNFIKNATKNIEIGSEKHIYLRNIVSEFIFDKDLERALKFLQSGGGIDGSSS